MIGRSRGISASCCSTVSAATRNAPGIFTLDLSHASGARVSRKNAASLVARSRAACTEIRRGSSDGLTSVCGIALVVAMVCSFLIVRRLRRDLSSLVASHQLSFRENVPLNSLLYLGALCFVRQSESGSDT